MEKLQCKNCMAPLERDGQSDVLVCPFCGTRYKLRTGPANRNRVPEVLQDGVGRGAVALIPSILQNAGGACFISTYVPEGWNIRCGGSPQGYGDPARDGAHLTTTMGHPGEKAFIIARSSQSVRHVEPSVLNRNGARQLNLAGVQFGGGGLEGTTRSAAEYDDEMVLDVLKGASLRLLREEDADEEEKKRQEQILSGCRMNGFTAGADWKRRYYQVTLPDGKRVNAAAECRIVTLEQGQPGGGLAAGAAGGGIPGFRQGFQGQRTAFGMPGQGRTGGFLGGLQDALQKGMQRMQEALRQRFWEVQYELLFIADEDYAGEAWKEFLKVRSTLQYLPSFEQYKARERQVVAGCIQQMAADRAASQQRRAQMMMDTQQHIHDTMSSMQQSASASHDRVAGMWSESMRSGGSGGYGGPGNISSQDVIRNRYSEMIRETDTYYGNDGEIYEVSTDYDRLYQGNRDQDSFIGTSGTAWEPGADYDELKKTNGRY